MSLAEAALEGAVSALGMAALIFGLQIYNWARDGDYRTVRIYHLVDSLVDAETGVGFSSDAESVDHVESLAFFHRPQEHDWVGLVKLGKWMLGWPLWWAFMLLAFGFHALSASLE